MKSEFLAFCLLVLITQGACDYMDYVHSHFIPSDELRAEVDGIAKKCVAETGVDTALIEGMEKKQYPDNHPLKCWIRCFAINFQALTHDGTILFDRIKVHMTQERHDAIFACQTIKRDDPCDEIYEIHKCYEAAIM